MIYTFYSFKGGVGRSMALANLAEFFYGLGLKVLMVDFDLEAPGLEQYFDTPTVEINQTAILARRGIIDMLVSYKEIGSLLAIAPSQEALDEGNEASEKPSFAAEPLKNFCTLLREENEAGGRLSLISAGRRDGKHFAEYTKRIQSFDWENFYTDWEGEAFFDWFCTQAKALADVVLVDSRTGITEMGGTCTHQIADCVLLFVGTNQQNLEGTVKMAKSLSNPKLIEQGRNRKPLSLLPIPSRIENAEAESLNDFAKEFKDRLSPWVPASLKFEEDFFTDLKIPYIPYYAYRERVATRSSESDSAKDLVFAFTRIGSAMAELAPEESHLRQTVELAQGKREIPQNLPSSGAARFVGRLQAIADLRQVIQRSNSTAITAIIGMAGVGKTELALQYALAQYQARAYPGGLCWLQASNHDVAGQIISFAVERLSFSPPNFDLEGKVQSCWQHWPAGKVLVVIDDVADYGAIAPYLPPTHTRFDVLLTTRLSLSHPMQAFPIQALGKQSAIELLESFAGATRIRSQMDHTQRLCERVGCLPLALELMGGFLARRPDLSISSLLERVEQQPLTNSALSHPATGMTAQHNVTESLSLSWQTLSEAEQTLACLLGLFAASPIGWHLVRICADNLALQDVEGLRDEGLVAHSLLNRLEIGRYQMHPLVRDFMRLQLPEQQNAGASIRQAFCKGMVAIAQATGETSSLEQTAAMRATVTHLEEMINQQAGSLNDADQIVVALCIGQFYASQGRYLLAEPWHEKALALAQQSPAAASSAATASILNKLAALYYEQGKHSKAEPLYQNALEIRRQRLGGVHVDVANTLNNLAILYNAQGKYEAAEPLFREALSMRRQLLGNNHADVASSLNNLATLYNLKGDLSKAEPLYLASLKLHRQILGGDHPNVATSLYNLAEFYRTVKKYAQAASLYREALMLRRQILGEEHPDVATTDWRLQTLYQTMRGL